MADSFFTNRLVAIFFTLTAASNALSPTDRAKIGARDCSQFFENCKRGCASNWHGICGQLDGKWVGDTVCSCSVWHETTTQPYRTVEREDSGELWQQDTPSKPTFDSDYTYQVQQVSYDCTDFFTACKKGCAKDWTASCGGTKNAWTKFTTCRCPARYWQGLNRRRWQATITTTSAPQQFALGETYYAATVDISQFELELHAVHNIMRHDERLQSLTYDTGLAAVAKQWSQRMASRGELKKPLSGMSNVFYGKEPTARQLLAHWSLEPGNPVHASGIKSIGCGAKTSAGWTYITCFYEYKLARGFAARARVRRLILGS